MNFRKSVILIFIKKDMIPVWIFIALVMVGIVFAMYSIFKNMSEKEHNLEIPSSLNSEKREATEAEKKIWRENYSRAQRLEQEIILLVNGESGMMAQREELCRGNGTLIQEMQRQNFLLKQEKLKEAYQEYYTLKKKIEELPESVGTRVKALEDDQIYQELMNVKL